MTEYQSFVTTTGGLVVGAICILMSLRYLTAPRRRYPPGPKCYPLIGSLLAIPKERAHWGFARWGTLYNSDIVHANACGNHIIVLNTVEAARELLDKKSSIYSDRPRMVVLIEMLDFGGTAFMRYGDRFRENRRTINQHFSQRATKEYGSLQDRRTTIFLADMLQDPEGLFEHTSRVFSSIILQVVYGHETKSVDDETVSLAARATELAFALPVTSLPGAVIDLVPILKHTPLFLLGADFRSRLAEGRDKIKKMFDKPFNTVKAEMVSGTALDSFTARLLTAHAQTGGAISAGNEDNIKRMAGHLHAAAGDTSFVVTTTFIMAMLLNPEYYEKVQSEIDRVVGADRLPTLDDAVDLPYLDAVIKEVYRWNPPTPLGLPHAVTEDDEYKGSYIPRGSTVIANIWWMLSNPDVFPEPKKFNPERFTNPDNNILDPRDVVFGFGRRICPGKPLGDSNAFLAISRLSACFNLSNAKDSSGAEIQPIVEFADGNVSHPRHFKCKLTPRSERVIELIREAQENLK